MKTSNIVMAAVLALPFTPYALAQDTPDPLPTAELQQLLDAYTLVKAQYVDTVDSKKLITDAIGGMLAALDPHSQYLDKEDLIDMEKTSSGRYVGIGVDVDVERGKMIVLSVNDTGPSARAGMRPGDVIVAIDGAGVTGLPISDISKRMRGEPGSIVTVALSRKGEPALRTLTLTREPLQSKTVEARQLERGLVWIRIAEFGGTTAAELAAALKKFDGKTPPAGLIVDLRNDPGGLVSAAVGVAAAFLPPDTDVFSARGRMPGVNVTVTASPRYYKTSPAEEGNGAPAWARQVPMAVLINGASISAAELLAGALQDHHRGVLLGTRTFGKGSIQSVVPLSDDSAVKMTVARYFTPSGREIQALGITPDIVVQPSAAATKAQNVLLREADLGNHLRASSDASKAAAGTADHAAGENAAVFGTRDDKALSAAIGMLSPTDPKGRSVAQIISGWQTKLRASLNRGAGY